jgi:protein-L-isoaspartate(D-aspartate) O-methyltransferase
MTSEGNFDALRSRMVSDQLAARGITDRRVLDAMAQVPRERFVPEAIQHRAYDDSPLPIGQDQTISQPYIVALTLQELSAGPDDRVLDVGAGSGYQSALLARLAREVWAIERFEPLAERARSRLAGLGVGNVHVVVGDGSEGLAEQTPFDRIVCGAAGPDVPPAWIDQLADGGRIVTPVGSRQVQQLVRLDKHGREVRRHTICDVRFVPLIGRGGWESA